jgi:hypothetical protein
MVKQPLRRRFSDFYAGGVRIMPNLNEETQSLYSYELIWDLSNLMLGTLFVMDHSFIPSKDYNGIGTGTQDIQVLIVNADGETTFEKTFQCTAELERRECGKGISKEYGCSCTINDGWLDLLAKGGLAYYKVGVGETRSVSLDGLNNLIESSGIKSWQQ